MHVRQMGFGLQVSAIIAVKHQNLFILQAQPYSLCVLQVDDFSDDLVSAMISYYLLYALGLGEGGNEDFTVSTL